MKKLLTVLSTICLCSNVSASELKFQFGSPSFSGNSKSTHYLTIENIEKTRQDTIEAQKNADAKARTPEGMSALELAAKYSYAPVTRLLAP